MPPSFLLWRIVLLVEKNRTLHKSHNYINQFFLKRRNIFLNNFLIYLTFSERIKKFLLKKEEKILFNLRIIS